MGGGGGVGGYIKEKKVSKMAENGLKCNKNLS